MKITKSQLKELIRQSMKEIDFKDQEAFKTYQSQHKMKPTTKVNIGGKDTTAGQASGGEEPAADKKKPDKPKRPQAKHTDKQFKKIAIPLMNDMLDDAIENYDGDFDDWMENGLAMMPPHIVDGLDQLTDMSNDDEVEEFMEKAFAKIEQHLEKDSSELGESINFNKKYNIVGETKMKKNPKLSKLMETIDWGDKNPKKAQAIIKMVVALDKKIKQISR